MEKPAVKFRCELITPNVAERYLSLSAANRKINHNTVLKYSDDMACHRWIPNHQALAFDEDGHLIDGQHRLKAIIHSGESVWMYVARGVSTAGRSTTDQGKTRTTGHILSLRGVKSTGRISSTARSMLAGRSTSKPCSRMKIAAFAEKHLSVIEDAIAMLSPRTPRLTTAPVIGVFARALCKYPESNERIRRAAIILLNSRPPDNSFGLGDQSMITLQKWLNKQDRHGGHVPQFESYCRAQYCLAAFLREEDVQKTAIPPNELFPFDNDARAED